MTTPRLLHLAPAPVAMHRVHVDRASYKSWIYEHCTSYAVRWARLDDYDRFVDRWPLLQDWFKAPLRRRLLDKENCVPVASIRTAARARSTSASASTSG